MESSVVGDVVGSNVRGGVVKSRIGLSPNQRSFTQSAEDFTSSVSSSAADAVWKFHDRVQRGEKPTKV